MKSKQQKKAVNKSIDRMIALSETAMHDYFFSGDAKPTHYISTAKIKKAMKDKGIELDVPRAKFICSFQQRLKAWEDLDFEYLDEKE